MLRKDVRKGLPSTGSVDPAEIARFNALADEWWKDNGAFKVIHDFNRVRVAHLVKRLPALLVRDPNRERPLAGMTIVDVGCGAGLVTEPISRLGATVIGIDAAEQNIRVAERHARASGAPVVYRHALAEDLVRNGQTFDVVLSLEVVEHVADLPAFLAALARLAAPDGVLVIGTINRTLRAFGKAIVGAEHVLRWLPRGTHDWRRFVTPAELALALEAHGVRTIERCGVAFNPLSRQWSIASDDSVTYLQFHRKT